MGINMRLFLLTGTLLLVQLSQQGAEKQLRKVVVVGGMEAAVLTATDASELAFPDGEAKDYDYGYDYEMAYYGYPYYLCKCSFEEYEEYWGVASVDVDTADTAWCPCFQYDEYEYNGMKLEYAYETEWPSQEADRSLDRKKKHHAGRSLDRKKK